MVIAGQVVMPLWMVVPVVIAGQVMPLWIVELVVIVGQVVMGLEMVEPVVIAGQLVMGLEMVEPVVIAGQVEMTLEMVEPAVIAEPMVLDQAVRYLAYAKELCCQHIVQGNYSHLQWGYLSHYTHKLNSIFAPLARMHTGAGSASPQINPQRAPPGP